MFASTKAFPPYDLLLMILECADRKTCAAAALVCRMWHGPALNEMWKEAKLIPLLHILAPIERSMNGRLVRFLE